MDIVVFVGFLGICFTTCTAKEGHEVERRYLRNTVNEPKEVERRFWRDDMDTQFRVILQRLQGVYLLLKEVQADIVSLKDDMTSLKVGKLRVKYLIGK